jgi:hypothetical protein
VATQQLLGGTASNTKTPRSLQRTWRAGLSHQRQRQTPQCPKSRSTRLLRYVKDAALFEVGWWGTAPRDVMRPIQASQRYGPTIYANLWSALKTFGGGVLGGSLSNRRCIPSQATSATPCEICCNPALADEKAGATSCHFSPYHKYSNSRTNNYTAMAPAELLIGRRPVLGGRHKQPSIP